MIRPKPRAGDYAHLMRPRKWGLGALGQIDSRPSRPPEQPGQKTVGPAMKRLKALLEEPRSASEAEVEAELDRLASARTASRAFILDVTEGEE